MKNIEIIEILERLRGYDFLKEIDYTNEFKDRLEKFIIFAGRTKKYQLDNGNELNYTTIKKMLKKKNIEITIDEKTFYNYNLEEYAKINIDSVKWRILDDLNVIFKNENIKFVFNKNSSLFNKNQINEFFEEIKFIRENKEKINKILNDIPLDNIEKEKVKIDIPDEILNMKSETVLSIRGNREQYRKFKMFVASLGIPLVDFTNYLFYFAMKKMTK
jgi:hypothetical protein